MFREHLHKHWIGNNEYLKNLILYVHLNPEKHGFSDSYQFYDFSSYKSIISKGETNLERKKVLDLFDDLENFIHCHQEKKIKIEGVLEEIEGCDL